MYLEWLGEHLVGVALAIALVLDRLELFQTPAFALFGRGVAIAVSLAAVLGLHRVLVIAEHLPSGLGIDVANQYRTVVVKRMRLASVVTLVVIGFGIVSQLGAGRPVVGTIARVAVVQSTVRKAPQPGTRRQRRALLARACT
eukprot:5853672-Pleurochrysis_carterae.AAC.1